jgi:sterol 3beta-glucosyltransferase
MKVALLTLGTRGDIQPFAVLGKALKARGHDVTISTAKNFSDFIASYDLPFVPVEADFQEVLNSPEGKKMMSNPFSARKHLHRLIYPMLSDALNTFYKVSRESDCVLFHVKAMGDVFADGCPGKFIRANVVPAIEPTASFINPIISFTSAPKIFNRFSYKLSDLGMKMMGKPIHAFRKKQGMPASVKKMTIPSIYGISSHFLQQPDDFPSNAHFTGFWLENSGEELDKGLAEFIRQGSPPLLFTLGSMPFQAKLNLVDAIHTLSKEHRFILIQGWGFNDIEKFSANENVYVQRSAPYDKLLPLVKGVIHHGGIGTMAACLKAGRPSMTCPVLYPLGDQHFWGMVAYRKGVGLKPIPLKKLTLNHLRHAVDQLVNNNDLHSNAENMRQKLAREDGIENAIGWIERYSQ